MKRPSEFDLVNPPLVNPESLMATSRGVAREAQAEYVQLEKMTEIAATQPNVDEGHTPDAEIAEVVKRLLEYLQPIVTLMATMVPPYEDSKIWEKKGSGGAVSGYQDSAHIEYSYSLKFDSSDCKSPF